MPAPRVSVVVPLYNLRSWVAEAIDSVLAQTLAADEVEIVVVDDGSTDGGGEVVAGYSARVRLVRQENRGLPAARNAGIRVSRAPFVAFLDADDRILPEKLAAQLAVFEERPGTAVVYTGSRYIDETGRPCPQKGWTRVEGDVLPLLVLGNLVHPHQPLLRRADLERVGGFDEQLTSAEDWDLWLRLARQGGPWACVDRPLAEYRVRHDAMHQNVARMAEQCLRVLDKLFADPDLPAAIVAMKPLAYQRRYLTAACDHYRIGERAAGARWLREAAVIDPAFLTDVEALRQLCRKLLPLGRQRGSEMVAELPALAALLRTALNDLFAAPDLEPHVARLRWRSRLATWSALLPLARKRATLRLTRRSCRA
jgi:hypothetical protein